MTTQGVISPTWVLFSRYFCLIDTMSIGSAAGGQFYMGCSGCFRTGSAVGGLAQL
jgi:hypothetical protein